MASSLLDVCRFNPTLGGTTDWTYSSAVTGYQSPTAAGAVNGAIYSYRAESANLAEWEVGFGAYNSGTGVFARTTVLFNSLGTTAKIAFSAAPQVAIVALAEDLTVTSAASKSDQQTGTSAVRAVTPSQQQSHDSAVKAWANASPGRTPTINLGYNVASVTSASVGNYVFNFTTPFANANYVCDPGFVSPTSAFTAVVSSQTASSVTIVVLTAAGGGVDPTTAVTISCKGRQ